MDCEAARRPNKVNLEPKSKLHSSTINQLLVEIENEATRPISKTKPPVKNYMKENLRRLKDIQDQAKRKDMEKQPLQPLRATNRYSQIQSKVSHMINAPCWRSEKTSQRILPKTAGPLRTIAPMSPCLSSRSLNYKAPVPSKSLPQICPVSEEDQVLEHQENDVVSEEQEDSMCSLPSTKRNEKSDTKTEARHRLGHIPSYLIERKKQWQKEKERQIKCLEDALIPAGHTLLPDDERLETLELLIKNRDELIQNLAALPIRNDTMRLRKYKEDLENQLAKVEEGIKIFSRPKVLIRNDT